MSLKSNCTIPAVAAISFCLIGGTSPAAADILHVPGDFPTIQEAIDAAVDGDEVEVHPGTYNETINLLGKAITVRSSDGADVTTINAGGSGTVVTCDSGEGADTVLDGFTITGGDASGGGGMRNSGSSPTVTNCIFSGNSAGSGGGGMYNFISNPTVTNCIFSGNSAGTVGAGMLNLIDSRPTVTNCTFSGNTAVSSGGGIGNLNSNPTLTNCVVWANTPDQFNGTASVSYSNVQGGWPGTGNIDANPLFVDPDNDDFRLMPGSPAIDAGNNWGVPIDENDFDEDGILCELFPVDLDGNPRFNADEADFDPGCGVPVVVDMGAYEYQFDPVENVVFADLNADGAVGVADLLGLLASWGPCAKGCCLADLDLDGDVGLPDLLALLANWGPCP